MHIQNNNNPNIVTVRIRAFLEDSDKLKHEACSFCTYIMYVNNQTKHDFYMWQSHVEIEVYSIVYFDRIAAFECAVSLNFR